MSRQVAFYVPGVPTPQGSHRLGRNRDGEAHIIADNSQSLDAWRNTVTAHAMKARGRARVRFDGPVALMVTFRFPIPASRPAAVRRSGLGWKAVRPDLDKLVRAVGDALTASSLIRDDAQIVELHAAKVESSSSHGATITVSPLEAVAVDGLPEWSA